MFYSHLILTKKGPLGKIWIAATLGESKISKSFATTAKIQVLCENIEKPAAPFALRLSASLMLGVVRVYSRKSTYILQDVKNVAQSLKRHSNHQSTRARGAKRGREISNRSAGDKISLDAGDDIANFDQITLPATKRQRERRTSGNDLPGSRSGRGHLTDSAENRSRSTFQIGDLSFGESGDIDVVQAMETLFPSVIVPPLRDHLESGLNSPSSGFRSENLATPLYKARDEDITLTAPSANLQDLGYEMFDEDLSVSLRSDPSSRAGDGRGGMEDGLEDAADMAAAFGAHRLDLSAAGTQEQTVPVHNPPDELFTIADPIEMEPPRTGPPHHAPAQADRPRGQPESEDDGLSTKGGGRKSVRSKAVEAENGNTTPFRTPSPNKTIPVSVAKFSTARKRRTPRFRVDEVTELSPTEVRACLHDTTDIVLPKEHRRVNRKQVRKTESREEDFPMPDFLAGFSTDITALWNEVSSQTTIDTDSREASPPRPLQSNGNRGTRAERRNSGSSSKNQENTAAARRGAPPPQDAFFPEQPEDFLDGPLAVPINERLEALNHVHSFRAPGPGPFSTQKGSTGSGSNEVLRAADEPGLLPVDNLSFPSNSAGHHTHSVSEPSGKTASRASGERLRDRLFEKITREDRELYDRARTTTKQAEGSNSDQTNDSGSPRGFKGAGRPGQDHLDEEGGKIGESSSQEQSGDDGRINVLTSDFQLMEETERGEEPTTQEKGPIRSISIQSFKLLELLRSSARQKAISATDGSQGKSFTTFGELMNDCSRGVQARAFFNVLGLVNSRFIEVEQSEPFGPISLKVGKFF